MRLDFHFDTEQDDAQLIKDVCAVLAGVSVKTDVTGPAESKPVLAAPVRDVPKSEPARQEPEKAPQVESQTAPKEEAKETPTRKVQPYDLSEDELKALPADILLDMLNDLGVDARPSSPVKTRTKSSVTSFSRAVTVFARRNPLTTMTKVSTKVSPGCWRSPHAPMTYEQAKPLVTPLWRDSEKKKIIQGHHG